MLNQLLEKLMVVEKRVIAVIPAVDLRELREIKKAQFMNKQNVMAAVAQNFFDYMQRVSADRFVVKSDEVSDEAAEVFKASERCELLGQEYNRLCQEELRVVGGLLETMGVVLRDGLSIDVVSGEIRKEVHADE